MQKAARKILVKLTPGILYIASGNGGITATFFLDIFLNSFSVDYQVHLISAVSVLGKGESPPRRLVADDGAG